MSAPGFNGGAYRPVVWTRTTTGLRGGRVIDAAKFRRACGDDLNPARGVVRGTLIGAALWGIVIAAGIALVLR